MIDSGSRDGRFAGAGFVREGNVPFPCNSGSQQRHEPEQGGKGGVAVEEPSVVELQQLWVNGPLKPEIFIFRKPAHQDGIDAGLPRVEDQGKVSFLNNHELKS